MRPQGINQRANGVFVAVVAVLATLCTSGMTFAAQASLLSPNALAASPDGRTLFVSCGTANRVLIVDLTSRSVKNSVALPSPPTGLAISGDGTRLFVTCAAPKSKVCIVDLARARLLPKLSAGHSATAPVLSPDGKTLFVCNRFNDDVSVFDLETKRELRRIPVQREPVAAAITPDGRFLLVANLLHTGRADTGHVAAVVSVIDTRVGQVVNELRLPNGSGMLNDIRVRPDGKYAVVTHILSRFHLPTTQIERGWMNTNAKTIIALDRMEVLNTVLLDNVDRGAANPWGAAWSADGKMLVIAHAGTHEVSLVEFSGVLGKLASLTATSPPVRYYSKFGEGSHTQSDVLNDLAFLVGLRERRKLAEGDLGPRAVVVVGNLAYTANYFSDTLSVVSLDEGDAQPQTIALGPKPVMSKAREGELNFHDARLCFQGWQSCASCHPGDARVDALNWDLLNDGIGNSKNNKSLLLAYKTPPAMSTGVRESAEMAVRAGIRHILFSAQIGDVATTIDEYLKSLKPVPSPVLVNGKLSAAAKRGQRLFRSREVGCVRCHPDPLFTDLQAYDAGTSARADRGTGVFDTPTLIEVWRTAPYLHNGAAATMREVLTTRNAGDHHGKTSQLTPDQINDLAAYVLSL